MKNWKKNLIAVALLVTVCGGIYVNWLYTEEQAAVNLTDTLDSEKVLSSDLLVMSSDDNAIENTDMTVTSDYFAAVRLSRQEARDSAVGLLQEAMVYDTSEDKQTNAQLEQLVDTALCEAQIESLVIAKGYSDCVAYITDTGVSVAVAVPENGFTQADMAVIADIVMTQSKFTLEDIRVVEVY